MRCFEKVARGKLLDHLKILNIPNESQFGFRKGMSCCCNLLAIQQQIFNWFESDKSCCAVDAVFLDWSKAFDKVVHNILLSKLEHYGLTGNFLMFLQNFLLDRQQRVLYNGRFSDWCPVPSGVSQGTVLAPLLFTVHVHDMPFNLQSAMFQYADDSVILNPVDSPIGSSKIHHDLPLLSSWCSLNGMEINGLKSESMRFTLKPISKPNSALVYAFNNVTIPTVTEHKHLGVILSNDLKYSNHIEMSIDKARKALFAVHRCFKNCTIPVRKRLINAFVLPILTYGIPAWLPTLQKDKTALISFQRLFTKVILRFPFPRISFHDRLESLNLLPFHLITTGIIARYFYKKHLNPNLFSLKIHRDSVIIKKSRFSRSSLFQRSYFGQVSSVWNNLPADVRKRPKSTFNYALLSHLRSLPLEP
jgi:hypothetical protein